MKVLDNATSDSSEYNFRLNSPSSVNSQQITSLPLHWNADQLLSLQICVVRSTIRLSVKWERKNWLGTVVATSYNSKLVLFWLYRHQNCFLLPNLSGGSTWLAFQCKGDLVSVWKITPVNLCQFSARLDVDYVSR